MTTNIKINNCFENEITLTELSMYLFGTLLHSLKYKNKSIFHQNCLATYWSLRLYRAVVAVTHSFVPALGAVISHSHGQAKYGAQTGTFWYCTTTPFTYLLKPYDKIHSLQISLWGWNIPPRSLSYAWSTVTVSKSGKAAAENNKNISTYADLLTTQRTTLSLLHELLLSLHYLLHAVR